LAQTISYEVRLAFILLSFVRNNRGIMVGTIDKFDFYSYSFSHVQDTIYNPSITTRCLVLRNIIYTYNIYRSQGHLQISP
jgi:hypothetical protein